MIDAVVVGAGPAGGMAARQLAAAGFSTTILEKRKVVGEPVQSLDLLGRKEARLGARADHADGV